MFFTSGIRPGGFNGGEFISNTSSHGTFRSFCLETNENITLSTNVTYSYEIVTTGAVNGGNGGGNPDPVSSASAWIFVQWITGAIANNQTNAVDVQRAIWSIENESAGTLSPAANALVATATGLYPNTADNAITSGNFPNIRVLNPFRMINGVREDYQSQIILIPLPTASGMALAGLALVGGIRRRK
ncbi:MAG: VPLPA-CTERM sorting domain-containing protein [bacterium]|nr:VPLPA-CTERM sorting domain-containing protein [bacterium]